MGGASLPGHTVEAESLRLVMFWSGAVLDTLLLQGCPNSSYPSYNSRGLIY
uniref:Uncharacterized protein n=1 Tax=Anguilla anguilla TaxID=7936 RepID=A0A0E9XYB0_ANGAN